MPDYSPIPDERLVTLMKTGDEAAFTEIYHRYWEKLFAISFSYCKQKHIAEEITQDIFMRVWDNRQVADIHSLSAYLATAARFSVFRYFSRTKKRSDLLEARGLASSISEEENINARFLKDYLNGVVESLPEKCRLVYRYSREQDLSVKEIAEQMRISPRTVESHLTKALKTLRIAFKHIRLWMLPEAMVASTILLLLHF